MSDIVTDEKIKEAVRETYGDIARRFAGQPGRTSCCGPTQAESCCGPTQAVSCCGPAPAASCCGPARASSCCELPSEEPDATGTAGRLYSTNELCDLPDSVTEISLGCGNPTAIEGLRPGETVLDLGSGGGIDCFLAAKQVGPEGYVIGLDMTTDMIKLARRNAKKMGMTNVEFRYGEMEEIPLPDESVDIVISNCVINLSPDKRAVFSEAYRVLRPGGRMHVSDIVINGELPQAFRDRLDAWAGCVAGALAESDYLDKIRTAGFEEVNVESRSFVKISEFAGWEDARSLVEMAGLSPEELDSTVASINVKAQKKA